MLSSGKSDFLCGLLVGILVASCGFALLYRTAGQQAVDLTVCVLKLGHGLDQTHPVHLGMVRMQERLAELSGGTMEIKIYPGGMLGSETQCLEQVQTGQLDMAKSSISPMESFWSELGVFTIPYVFRDNEHLWKVLEGEVGEMFLDMSPQMYGICYYDAGGRSFYTVRRPILSPEDLKGMKIRVQASRTAMDMVRHMGAAPTPIAWGELYTALSQGTVDGAENNLPSFESGRHSEICRHFVLNEHAFVPDMLLINRVRWEKLTPQQQQWLKAAAMESSVYQRELWKLEEQRCREEAEKRGVQFYEVDKAPFIAITKPMRESITDPAIREILKKIMETQ
jgi:tripartite ATP-independent transporter DctP family solute receptor